MAALGKTDKNSLGFTLVEMMVTMVLFAVLALAFTKSLTFSKFLAEDNLYDATALTMATSLIEQIKGASIDQLIHPPQNEGKDSFEMLADGATAKILFLDEPNLLKLPIVTDKGGQQTKTLDVQVRPSVSEMESGDGFWIEVEYSYDHPATGRTRTNVIRNARSTIPSS